MDDLVGRLFERFGRANGYINVGNVRRIISPFVTFKPITTVKYLYIVNPAKS